MSEDDDVVDDLSEILEFVAFDRRPAARRRIANSPDTRAFLEVGMTVLTHDLLNHTGQGYNAGDTPPVLFSSLSRARLVEEGDRLRDSGQLPEKTMTSNGQFRDRWRYSEHFTEDLISYLFRDYPYAQFMQSVRDAIEIGPMKDASLAEVIQGLAMADLDIAKDDPSNPLRSLIQVALPNHPRVRARSVATYRNPAWLDVFEVIGLKYGVSLRMGYSWQDVAELFTVVIEGLIPRALMDMDLTNLSSGGNILVTAIRLMLPSLLEGGTPDMRFEEMYPVVKQ